jgi:hypothetical protein
MSLYVTIDTEHITLLDFVHDLFDAVGTSGKISYGKAFISSKV